MSRIWCPQGHVQVPVERLEVSRGKTLFALLALTTVFLSVTAVRAAAAPSVSNCKISISGAPWKIGPRSGSTYVLAARGIPCASTRSWVVTFTHQTNRATGAVTKGPGGFSCRSLSTASSGDKLLYSGVCMKGPHNTPFFEWAPKP